MRVNPSLATEAIFSKREPLSTQADASNFMMKHLSSPTNTVSQNINKLKLEQLAPFLFVRYQHLQSKQLYG